MAPPTHHLPARITGNSTTWSRDFAVVGAVTGALAPGAVLLSGGLLTVFAPYVAAAAVIGAASGALLGAVAPRVLDRLRGRVSLPALMLGGVTAGSLWGGTVGALAACVGVASIEPTFAAVAIAFSATIGAVAGALQFGWLWFPYTFQTVLDRRRWPLVAAACLAAPVIGFGSLLLWSIAATMVGIFV